MVEFYAAMPAPAKRTINLTQTVFSDKYLAVDCMKEQGMQFKSDRYLKEIIFGNEFTKEYSIVEEHQIIDLQNKCYIAKYSCQNNILIFLQND